MVEYQFSAIYNWYVAVIIPKYSWFQSTDVIKLFREPAPATI